MAAAGAEAATVGARRHDDKGPRAATLRAALASGANAAPGARTGRPSRDRAPRYRRASCQSDQHDQEVDRPQRVTLHGRDAVVVVDAEAFDRLRGAQSGELLVQALQASPHRQIGLEPGRSAMPVRAVKL